MIPDVFESVYEVSTKLLTIDCNVEHVAGRRQPRQLSNRTSVIIQTFY